MEVLKWSPKYSVGIELFDNQHKYLVSTLNELLVAMRKKKIAEKLGDIITRMVNYTKFHFQSEEQLMQELSYPDLGRHRQEHLDFVAKVTDFQQKFSEGQFLLSMKVYSFLKDWLLNHIAGSDKSYTEFLSGKDINKTALYKKIVLKTQISLKNLEKGKLIKFD